MSQAGSSNGRRRPPPGRALEVPTIEAIEGPIAIPCPWHTMDHLPHPPGSPDCIPDPAHIGRQLIGLGELIAWITVICTDLGRAFAPTLTRVAEISDKMREIERNIFGDRVPE